MSTENKSVALSNKVDTLKIALNEPFVQTQLQAALQENSASFAASIIDVFTGDTQLQECNPKLVIMQALKAATLRLPLVKSLGYAWIVQYKNVPQFQIGYKGLIQLAIRTGQYKTIHTDVVYEGEYRSTNKLTGEFDFNGQATSGNVFGYFAHFELKNGFSKTLFMTKQQVNAHAAKYSKSFNSQYSPWKSEFDSMALKTVLSALLRKWGYMSVEMVGSLDDEEKDLANDVLNEVRGNANRKDMAFEEADVVPEQNSQPANQPAPF